MKEIAVMFMVLILFIGGLAAGLNRIMFPGSAAEIEQLRKDATVVSAQESEDVIGQITQWNQTIVSHQRYNNIWWSDWAIPDGWNDVKLIKIPSR